ncbi:MAG: hypothetical protein IPQ07_20685 [Myxococcales bacterium]|nr:hypothetical protein [Myxococcales bacterium]
MARSVCSSAAPVSRDRPLRGGSSSDTTAANTPPAQPQTTALPGAATPAPREAAAPQKVQVDLQANVQNARVTFRRRLRRHRRRCRSRRATSSSSSRSRRRLQDHALLADVRSAHQS